MIPRAIPAGERRARPRPGRVRADAIHVFAGDPQGRVAFCCRLSDAEIAEVVATRSLWIQQLTFGKPFQPIALTTHRPHDLPEVDK